MNIKTRIKNLFNKKLRENEQIRSAIIAAQIKAEDELTKIHGKKVEKIIKEINTEKQIEVESIKIEMDKIISENEKLKKRNDYCENLYFDAVEIAKKNSIVSQEMSTDARTLEIATGRLTGLIHGINTRAQDHYEKMEVNKMKVRNKLKDMEEK